MTTTRCMFVGQGGSGLPEDRFINVFHFHDPTILPWDDSVPALLNAVENFYVDPTSNGGSIGAAISSYVSRSAQLIFYNMGQAQPRVPEAFNITLPSALGQGAPEEVAICLSLHGAPPVTARRRGRIYIGPLSMSTSVIQQSTTTTPSRVQMTGTNAIGVCIAQAAERLRDEAIAAGVPWCIRSTVPTENYVPIVSGYVDNAFDIQRKRGPDDTVRHAWS